MAREVCRKLFPENWVSNVQVKWSSILFFLVFSFIFGYIIFWVQLIRFVCWTRVQGIALVAWEESDLFPQVLVILSMLVCYMTAAQLPTFSCCSLGPSGSSYFIRCTSKAGQKGSLPLSLSLSLDALPTFHSRIYCATKRVPKFFLRGLNHTFCGRESISDTVLSLENEKIGMGPADLRINK